MPGGGAVRCESARHAPESAASISALSAQGCASPGNARPMSNAEPSSPDTGPESPATPTYENSPTKLYVSNQRREVREMEVSPALSSQEGGLTQAPFVAVNLRGREEGARPELAEAVSLRAASGGSSSSYVLTSSAAGSRARTSQSQEPEPDSPANGPVFSSTSPDSPQLFSHPELGSSLRTWTDSFPQTVDEISPSFSRRWPSSGFTTSPGECSTADTSECPSDGDASSSLPGVLSAEVPPRFYLSPRAAAGLLRRAAKRGRALPPPLSEALVALASQHREDDKTTTTTPHRQDMLWDPSCAGTEATTPRSAEDISSQPKSGPSEPPATTSASIPPSGTPSSQAPSESTPATIPTEEPRPAPSLRRLVPTERERLQGFPDGWTIPYGPSLAPQSQDLTDPESNRWATPSPSPLRSGSGTASSNTREAA